MGHKVLLLGMLSILCLSSCSGLGDVDDLTIQDYSKINAKKPYFSIVLLLGDEPKTIYASNLNSAKVQDVLYEKGDDRYVVCIVPNELNDTDYVVADKTLSKELDCLFENAVFNKTHLSNNVMSQYLTTCLVYTNEKYYFVDAMGHLVYCLDDSYYRSDLKVNIEGVYRHRFYIEELHYDKMVQLADETIFTYKNKTASFEEIKPYLKHDGRHHHESDKDIYISDINYNIFDDLPESEDCLSIGDNVRVTKNHVMYAKYDKHEILGHYVNNIIYTVAAPMVVSGDVGDTFDAVFAYLENKQ